MTDEDYYTRVRNCGLKPVPGHPTVWQTLDEQDRVNVPLPSTKDDDEKEIFLKELWERMQSWKS